MAENIFGKDVKIFKDVVVRASEIGDDSVIGDQCFITDSVLGKKCTIERRGMMFNTNIGDFSYTGYNTVVKYAEIGKFCSISWNVSIGGANHDYTRISTHPFPFREKYGLTETAGTYSSFDKPLEIGNDVWIGSGVNILRNVKIGDGAVIGAGAVVTHDIPPYEIWAGVPARKVGQRFDDDVIEFLEKMKWWNYSEDYIRNNINMFQMDNITLEQLKKLNDNYLEITD